MSLKDIRNLTIDEIKKTVSDRQIEQQQLQLNNENKNFSIHKKHRREIARLKTILREKQGDTDE